MKFNKYGQQLSEKKAPKAETPTPATIRYLLEQAPKSKFQVDNKAGS